MESAWIEFKKGFVLLIFGYTFFIVMFLFGVFYWEIRSIIIVRSIEDQFISHSFGPGNVFMIFHSMNMIINSHSFHEEQYWKIRSQGIVKSIEDQFISHSFGHENMFMIFHSMSMIIICHSFREQQDW